MGYAKTAAGFAAAAVGTSYGCSVVGCGASAAGSFVAAVGKSL